jgi:SAM-dependent methyltransferase
MKLIDPKTLIASKTVEEFCMTADKPFAEVTDPTPLMAKPFGHLIESPYILYQLGLLLTELKFARTLRIVDFGSGTCWLSRSLAQMGAITVSVDPSASALKIGKQMFERYPPVGGGVAKPEFLLFNGHTIDLPDESVDRIVTFDSFHHIPNQQEVIAEFARILKPGGIAGFSEPARYHSRTAMSQHEMRTHDVLENDMLLEKIWAHAEAVGFTKLTLKYCSDPLLNKPHLHRQKNAVSWLRHVLKKPILWKNNFNLFKNAAKEINNQSNIFFLHKGELRLDTRMAYIATGGSSGVSHENELLHDLKTENTAITGIANQTIALPVNCTNKGSLIWLHKNNEGALLNHDKDYAVVKLGCHLLDIKGNVINNDFARSRLMGDLAPGQSCSLSLNLILPSDPGDYILELDMVLESIVWFANAGNQTLQIPLKVV